MARKSLLKSMSQSFGSDVRLAINETGKERESFAGCGGIFVDRCAMIFQRLVKILIHSFEQFCFLRLKLHDALR
jgi:hypothetical protein